jgi:hypothetical protein
MFGVTPDAKLADGGDDDSDDDEGNEELEKRHEADLVGLDEGTSTAASRASDIPGQETEMQDTEMVAASEGNDNGDANDNDEERMDEDRKERERLFLANSSASAASKGTQGIRDTPLPMADQSKTITSSGATSTASATTAAANTARPIQKIVPVPLIEEDDEEEDEDDMFVVKKKKPRLAAAAATLDGSAALGELEAGAGAAKVAFVPVRSLFLFVRFPAKPN